MLYAATTLFLSRALPALFRAILVFSIARKADSHQFAQIAMALVVVETLRLIFDLGQDTISVRQISRGGKVWRRAVHAAITIKTCTWILGATVNFTLVYAFVLRGDAAIALPIALVGVSQIFWNLPINILQARGWLVARSAAVWGICGVLGAAVCGIVFRLPVRSAIQAYALLEYAGLLAFGILAYRAARAAGHGGSGRTRKRQIVLYLRRGWSVCVGQLAALAYGKFDVILVSAFSPTLNTANYLFAQRTLDLAGFLAGGASSVMYASLARVTGRTEPAGLREAARHWLRLFVLIAFSMAVGFWLLVPMVIRKWFDARSGSIAFVWVFGAIALLALANQYFSAFLNSFGRYTLLSRINLSNLWMIVALGSFGFWLFGPFGLLAAIAIVYASSALWQGTIVRRSLLSH